jgi:hypothetical protein
VRRGFPNIYPTFRQKSTKGNFRVADKRDISDIALIQTAVAAVHYQYRFGLKSKQAYALEKPLKTEIGAVSVEDWIDA